MEHSPNPPRPAPAPADLAALLALCGAAVLVYTGLRYRRDLADAEYTPEEYAELERRREAGEDV